MAKTLDGIASSGNRGAERVPCARERLVRRHNAPAEERSHSAHVPECLQGVSTFSNCNRANDPDERGGALDEGQVDHIAADGECADASASALSER